MRELVFTLAQRLDDARHRSAFARALGTLGDARAVTPLANVLAARSTGERPERTGLVDIVEALGRIGGDEAVIVLAREMIDGYQDYSRTLHVAIAGALAGTTNELALRSLAIVAACRQCEMDLRLAIRDALRASERVRLSPIGQAWAALGQEQWDRIPPFGAAAIAPLLDAIEACELERERIGESRGTGLPRDRSIASAHESAVRALASIRDASAEPALLDALVHELGAVRRGAKEALIARASQGAREALRRMLLGGTARSRSDAVSVLAAHGWRPTTPAEVDALADTGPCFAAEDLCRALLQGQDDVLRPRAEAALARLKAR
jgi:hypothetical protein